MLSTEIRAAFYDSPKRPAMLNFICGLGGREVTLRRRRREMFDLLQKAAQPGESRTPNVHWIGVRE